MVFQEKEIPSLDDSNINLWEIPSPGSKKIVLFTHPMLCSKSGYTPSEKMQKIAPQ
jgi:hypothetical protein